MRLVALVGGDATAGLITDNENVVGEITLEGTLFLVLFAGVATGSIGGLLYMAVRRWLPGQARWSGLVFGLLVLLVLSSVVINSDNPDFEKLGNPRLSIPLFLILFHLFGLVIAPLAAWVEKALPVADGHRLPKALPLVYLAMAVLPLLLVLVAGSGGVGLGIAVVVIATVPLWPLVGRRLHGRLFRPSPRDARRAGYAVLGILAIAGTASLIREIIAIL